MQINLVVTFVLILMSGASWAQVGGMVALIDEAAEGHPAVSSREAGVTGARAAVDQARWSFFPTPEVSITRQWLPGSDRRSQGEVFTAGVRQPLWSGGGLRASLAQERARERVAGEVLDEVRLDLGVGLVEAYGEWLGAYQRYHAWEDHLRTHEELGEQLINRLEIGVASQSDKALLETRLATVRAEYGLFGSQVAMALGRLSEVMGRPVTSAELDALDVTPLPITRGLRELEESVLAGHPAIRQADLEIEVSRKERDWTQAQRMPEVSLLVQREMSLANEFEDTNVITLEVRSRLGPGLSTWSADDRAAAMVESARYEREAVAREIRERVTSDYALLNALDTRIVSMQNADRTSREVLASYRRQYLAGQKSWLDVMNSAGDVMRAQSELIEAEVARIVVSWRMSMVVSGLASLPRKEM